MSFPLTCSSDWISYLRLEYEAGGTPTGVVFGTRPQVAAAASLEAGAESCGPRMLWHVTVAQGSKNGTLTMDDGEATFDHQTGTWTMKWKWSAGEALSQPIGTGTGEYSRKKLTGKQEDPFQKEVDMWQKRQTDAV